MNEAAQPVVLIYSSAPGMMNLYNDIMQLNGFKVQGLERLDHWQLHTAVRKPEAILIGLEKINGEFSVFEKIRSQPGLESIPIILMCRGECAPKDRRLLETVKVRVVPFNQVRVSDIVEIVKAAAPV